MPNQNTAADVKNSKNESLFTAFRTRGGDEPEAWGRYHTLLGELAVSKLLANEEALINDINYKLFG